MMLNKPTTDAESVPCHVMRCLVPAAWQLTIEDDGRPVTNYACCPTHAAQNVEALPRPGRRITLDALQVVAVAR